MQFWPDFSGFWTVFSLEPYAWTFYLVLVQKRHQSLIGIRVFLAKLAKFALVLIFTNSAQRKM